MSQITLIIEPVHHLLSHSQPDDKYKALRKVVSSYAIVSMGVACFQWQPVSSTAVPCRAEVFNLLLLSQHSYTMDPSSAQFLLKHGFDFNKQLRYGLPFTPVGGGGPFTGKVHILTYHTPSHIAHTHTYYSWWSCFITSY